MAAWFREDLSRPVPEFASATVHGLAWEDLAEDIER